MTFKTGDRARVNVRGHDILANVALASANGRSLMLTFDGIAAGYVGMLPVIQREDGEYTDLAGNPIYISKEELQ